MFGELITIGLAQRLLQQFFKDDIVHISMKGQLAESILDDEGMSLALTHPPHSKVAQTLKQTCRVHL